MKLLPLALCLLSCAAGAQQLLAVDTRLNRVITLDATTGAVLNPNFITDAGSAATYDFLTPRAAIQVGNEIWVTDQSPSANAIFRFDLSGNYLNKISNKISNVRGMRFIDGVVYVVNAGTTNGGPGAALVKFAPDGRPLGNFSTLAGGGTIGASPWDVVAWGNQLLVSDGTSRALQIYNTDGSHAGAFSGAINNIPQQMQVLANGHVLLAANGSTPTASYGLYELNGDGSVFKSWTGAPGLGARGVAELGNGQYLISESGGASNSRGLGTVNPTGVADNSNFTLVLGAVNGGWLSPFNPSPVPEPATWGLMGLGLALLVARQKKTRSAN